MNKELMDKGLKMLESGRYKQGKGYLGNARSGYCCLGIFGLAGDCYFNAADSFLNKDAERLFNLGRALTNEEFKIFGLNECSDYGRQNFLASLNDGQDASGDTDNDHLTFPQIVQMIRYLGWDKE